MFSNFPSGNKEEPGKFCMIHNLYYPYSSLAVNLNIPNNDSTVEGIQQSKRLFIYYNLAVEMPLVAKSDSEEA